MPRYPTPTLAESSPMAPFHQKQPLARPKPHSFSHFLQIQLPTSSHLPSSVSTYAHNHPLCSTSWMLSVLPGALGSAVMCLIIENNLVWCTDTGLSGPIKPCIGAGQVCACTDTESFTQQLSCTWHSQPRFHAPSSSCWFPPDPGFLQRAYLSRLGL